MTESVLVVGTGLIGGSVGLALRGAGRHVVGFDAVRENASAAVSLGAVDEACDDLEAELGRADVVLVATPVGEVLPTLQTIASSAAPGTVVTDVDTF